ncbi:MAG: hypothetical protein E4G74_03245 [Erysipelotrichales bacterium]|nr:MAG: hypothetical protein E4G74_03245 [Erysipelotrichales bacterium]
MKKLILILRKANGLTFKATSEDTAYVKAMKAKFEEYRLPFDVRDDFSYFRNRIMYRSIQNKEAFEQSFDRTRNQLFEMWESLNFQERNRLANLELNRVKEGLPCLQLGEDRIWIPFFDDLLNSLYDHQIAIFELPQYFKLYRQFADKTMRIELRGLALWSAGFVDWINVAQNDTTLVFYYEPMHCLFRLNDAFELMAFPLHKTPEIKANQENLVAMGEALLINDEIKFIRELLESRLVDAKTKIRIGAYLKRNHNSEGKK